MILHVCTELLLFSHREQMAFSHLFAFIDDLDFKSDKMKTSSFIYFWFRSSKVSYYDIDQRSKHVNHSEKQFLIHLVFPSQRYCKELFAAVAHLYLLDHPGCL